MNIKVNGEFKVVPEELMGIPELLKRFEVQMPEYVSVQLNGTFLLRKDFDSTNIKANDEIDFLYFMGGGQ
jgi:sulfur carrier protein